MADAIILEQDEQYLYDAVNRCVGLLHEYYTDRTNHEIGDERFSALYAEMAKKAYSLHHKLKARNLEPRHHKYMLKNRDVPVDDEEFYNHIHPVEDLLAFINNPEANNDPEDSTIGEKFDFDIFTRRWGHIDSYTLVRTDSGWLISGGSAYDRNECDKCGNEGVFSALNHDSVNYPQQLGSYLEAIWNCAAEGANKDSVQHALSSLSKWISYCEKTTPQIDILEGIL
ncbi:MAG: hypothetical protein FWH55_14955 [Oscillospiraceae bacterium]|nr:hypothetical protein [Oscillospiraceae bacterium]